MLSAVTATSGTVRLLCSRALRCLATDANITLPNGRTLELPESDITFFMPGTAVRTACIGWLNILQQLNGAGDCSLVAVSCHY